MRNLELKKRRIRFRTKIYDSRKYIKILERDNYICSYCGTRVFSNDDIYKMVDNEKEILLSKYLEKVISHKQYEKQSDTLILYQKYKSIYQKKLATIDHIIPLSIKEDNSFENLITCCFVCNCKKGDKYEN